VKKLHLFLELANGTLYDILHNPLIVVINGAKDTLSSKRQF